jgi:S1-C subfamily serine protease
MKLPIGQFEKSDYKSNLKHELVKRRLIFFISVFFLAFCIIFMHTVAKDITKPLNSKSITQPVAYLLTSSGNSGTAFLTGSKTLITARHVVEDINIGEEVSLIFNQLDIEVRAQAKLVWKEESETISPMTDFAVLKLIDPSVLPDDMPTFTIGFSSDVNTEDEIKAIGYPNGIFSVTKGEISNTTLQFPEEEFDLFTLNCNIYPGNSGGPILLVESEEVIGIAELAMTDEFQGINFASKIDRFVEEAEKAGINLYE